MGFRIKLIISYASVIFLTLLFSLLLFALLAQQIQNTQRNDAEGRLSRQAMAIQGTINGLCRLPQGCEAYLSQYRQFLLVSARMLDARILMVDQRGLVWLDTANKDNLEDAILKSYKLVARDNAAHNGSVELNGTNYIFFALPGPDLKNITGSGAGGTKNLGAVSFSIQAQLRNYQTDLVLAVPEATLGESWNNLLGGLLFAGLLSLSLSALAAIFIARSVAKPLLQMTKASEAIASGDYSQQMPVRKGSEKDEMGRLALTFNRMAREVARSQQSMRDFVANVSHELKTPLTSIHGFSQAILDGTADDPVSLGHSADVISREAVRMRRLVDELLDLSRIESGQVSWTWREVDLKELLQRVTSKLEPLAIQKDLSLVSNLELNNGDYKGLLVFGDSDRLEQVFTNILDNAIKYSYQGGQIQLYLKPTGGDLTKLSGSGQSFSNGRAIIQISNNGPYIPPEEQPRIFERFYKLDKSRSRRKGESTGLGLSIVKELVEAHKGSITVTSFPVEAASLYPEALPATTNLDGLTTFTVNLPLKP